MFKKIALTGILSLIPLSTNVNNSNKFDFPIPNSDEQAQFVFADSFESDYLKSQEDTLAYLFDYEQTKDFWAENYDEKLFSGLTSFKEELVSRGFCEREVKSLLRNARLDDDVTRLFRRNLLKSADSGEVSFEEFSRRIGLDWFVSNAQGFADKHEEILKKTEVADGVDYRFVVGILGIETKFGDRNTLGNYNLVNSLITQYVTTNRKTFAIREFSHVLKLSKKYREDLTDIKGSYAGAIGVGQWIPSSVYNYSKIDSIDDLFSVEGIIPSVSNYLKLHNWDSSANGSPLIKGSRNWRAVRAYNHSDTYVRVVNEIALGVNR
jgi:membrane-bound lytic murein transglycosylase B